MESVRPVSKLSTEFVGSRRELVAKLCSHHRRRDTTRQLRRVGSVCWALDSRYVTYYWWSFGTSPVLTVLEIIASNCELAVLLTGSILLCRTRRFFASDDRNYH